VKSYLVPTVDKDGKISEVTVSYLQPIYRLQIKVPVSSLLEFRTKGDIVTCDEPPFDFLYLESFMFEADKHHRCRLFVYISTKLFADKRITEKERKVMEDLYIKERMNWFFTYGERVK